MRIKPLTGIGIELIHESFIAAFSDYTEPIRLSAEELRHMIERRGYRPDLSFGAFEKETMAGFTLNGLGEWQGRLTAYDVGTGVIPEFRQLGIASRIFDESLPVLKKQGITHYLLEVIRTNTKAVDLYRKSGFTITREFDYYVSPRDQVNVVRKTLPNDFQVKRIEVPNWELFPTFWDFQPSWQNSIDSIARRREGFTILGIYLGEAIVGYGIIEESTGDIPQLAIHPDFRRQRLATELLFHLMGCATAAVIKIINTWTESVAMKAFLASVHLHPRAGQYEMILEF